MKLRIFTDGACSDNPGPGGWAAVFCLKNGYKTISGNEKETTNNRMELIAVIEAIKKAKSKGFEDIEVHSDSAYVVNAVNKGWITNWKFNNWKTAKKDDVKNKDLWVQLDELISGENKITFIKVKGHSGNTFNEIADDLAVVERDKAKELK